MAVSAFRTRHLAHDRGEYTSVIFTAGVSLFSRGNVFGMVTHEKGLLKFDKTNPISPPNRDQDVVIREWLAEMRSFIKEAANNPANVSAEYSLLQALKENRQLASNPEVILFHTDTLGGRAAAQLLKAAIAEDFDAAVVLKEVQDFDVKDRVRLNKSLGAFMQLLGETLEQHAYSPTCFAPIGGYKVMTAFAYMAGSFYGVPTAYWHEDCQVLQYIPPLPVEIDADFLTRHAGLIRSFRISDIKEWREITEQDREVIKGNPYFFERVGDLVTLNADYGVTKEA